MAHQKTSHGADEGPDTTANEPRPYATYDEVVTPNGTGYVVALSEDGILVNEGGTYQLYLAGQLSRPGKTRPPEPVDTDGAERRARKLAAAISPEGLELPSDNARLARLNLDEGHGQVLNDDGVLIGWIRRRGHTWYGQDARGGIRRSTSWTETKTGGPIRAAALMAAGVAYGAHRDKSAIGGEPLRRIRPEEVTAPIFYSGLTDAQVRELRTLAEQWKSVADPELRTAAEKWSQEITTAQMRRLATAVEEVAAHADITTPEGRRRQGVLERLAANVRAQAHAAEGAFSTLPPPGEPDPWARSYRPQENLQPASTSTSTELEFTTPTAEAQDRETAGDGRIAGEGTDVPSMAAATGPQGPAPRLSPDLPQKQGELFTVAVPIATTAATEPDTESGAALPTGPTAEEPPFPKLTQAASHALFDVARGQITAVDGIFMKQIPTGGTTANVRSQKAVNDLLDSGLAERVGQDIALSERGTAWFAHHRIKLPATGLRDTSDLDPGLLPPIDYTPLGYLPVVDEQPERLRPPAPGALPANWHSRSHGSTEAEVQATKDMAAAAKARAAQSTARDLEELAAGPEAEKRWVWRSQFPLAQYDENAAAALEHLTDRAVRAYATQAVHQLRAAIETVGRTAAADYVQRIRGAGTDPMAMDKVWRTSAGIQADDTYRHRVRGIVITYLEAIGAHAEEIGLDWRAIVHTLEDAAGWKGEMQPLTLRHHYAHAYFPDVEEIAESARFVARALHEYALGESDAVDAWAHLRDTWRPIEPRPAPIEPVATGGDGVAATVETPLVQAAPDAPAAAPPAPVLPLQAPTEGASGAIDGARAEAAPQPADNGEFAPQSTPARERRTPTSLGAGDQTTKDVEAQSAVISTSPQSSNTSMEPGNGGPVPAPLDGPGSGQPADTPPAVGLEARSAPPTAEPAAGPGRSPADAAPERSSEPTSDTAAPPTEEGVATSGPPTDDRGQPATPASPLNTDAQLGAPPVQSHASPDAYATSRAALLRELDGQEQWLAQSPAAAAAAATVRTATPRPGDGDSEEADGLDAPVPLAGATPAPTGPAEDRQETSTDADAAAVKAPAAGNRPQNAIPASEIRSKPRPAAAREEGTVATSAPPSAASAEQPAAPSQTGAHAPQLVPGAAAAYPDAAAYAAAHEVLLTELDQHERWLALTPAAAEAATTLADTGGLGIPGLSALLALQAALGEGPDEDGQRAHLAQLLGHHIRRGQMTMAKIFFAQATRTSSTDELRDLYERAVEGQFLAFGQQTGDSRLELGQYIPMRARQITQQSDGAEHPAEPTPQTAQEADPMAADPDDDIQLPVLELAGDVHLTAEEAAPRLLAHAQTHLASGRPDIEQFARIHGRPVYAMVPEGEAPALYLGLTPPKTEGGTRAVSIRGDELAAVTAETLLTAVTGWLNGSDSGDRPLLDYASGTAPAPAPLPTEQEAPGPTHSPAPTAELAEPTMAKDTVAQAGPPLAPAPGAPAEGPAAQATQAATQPAPEPAPAQPSDHEAQAAPPARAAAASTPKGPSPNTEAGEQARAEDARQETTAAPAADPNRADQADPAAQITALVRTALSDGGVTLDATGVLTAQGTVTITLETSGTPERDRELADTLRTALNNAFRQHAEQQLAAYRVDFEHTTQPGQGSLPKAANTTVIPVPRDRLIAANNAAAKIFAERLHSDPNAELARTYLSHERKLPDEVQQEWGLGYAPSDRGDRRWDLLVVKLTAQGFTEDELLHAGLATRSKRGTLIDAFDDRIMFPIHDEHGDVVGFSGRRIDRPGETEEQAKERQSQKYFNTSNEADLFNKSELLFGLHHPAQAEALAGSNGPRISVEGYLDVIAVARAAATLPLDRRPVVGAPMGADISESQLTRLRGLDSDDPRPHIMFLDADDSGHKVLLSKSNELLRAPAPTEVTTAPGAKDAAKLWEEGIEADGDGVAPVLAALDKRRPLLDAIVEAVLLKHADESERANHAFNSDKDFQRSRFIAAEAARYIHQAAQVQAPGDRAALEQAALTWAKRLDQEWGIRGFMTATAVLLGPGKHHQDHENEMYEQALDLLAADPEGYFANDSHVRSRQSAPAVASDTESTADRRPGQWPAGTRPSGPMTSTSPSASEPAPASGELALSMFLPSPDDGHPVEHTDRTTAAYALHMAVRERLGQHTTESPDPDRLPQPVKLGTVYGVDLSTSGDDQTSEDPTVVVWLGSARSDSLRMSSSRLGEMTGPELLAAIEWRAAQAARRLGAPLSPNWRKAVRSILPAQFPAQPTPAQLADLLDTIAQAPEGTKNRTRRRAEQAMALYTAGHPDLALNVLADDDHIWVLRNDGSWIQEEAVDTELSWKELETGFDQEAAELKEITQAATELPPADETPMAADLTVAHHSAHEALAALRPYSIGLPGTVYEKITHLVAQMDAGEPAMRRLHGPGGEQLMNRAKTSFVRILEGLATVASKIRLTGLSNRLERAVARIRGQDLETLPTPRPVRGDRRMQDLAHIERDLERRMAFPSTTLGERGELQEQWIKNRARWRARYEQLHGQPPGTDFLPDNGLVAGAPPVPNLIAAHELLLDRLTARVAELRDTDPHTGEDANPYEPTADLLNGVAWAYQQRLIGFVPTGDDPQGPIPPAQLRQAALTVTSHQKASPLTLRRTMNVSAERADRLLRRLEEQQILGPYRADAPRTVLARAADIDTLLAQPATPPAATDPAPTTKRPAPGADPTGADADEVDAARIREFVTKMLADKQTRSETHSEPNPADSTAPASRVRTNLRKNAHREAEANALAAGQSTSLAQSPF
ncbi:hypothetical protein [Streptomyces noursei]|uniref:hypothetical protein n=1 Tax=Streptomyces noursei TaxID=1971 RepID=UPI003823113D